MGDWPWDRPGPFRWVGQLYNQQQSLPIVPMCLAVPGRILSIASQAPDGGPAGDLWRTAEVDFGGVRQEVSLACLPEARIGDRVLVHVGFALSVVEEPEPLS